jgi:hypothetical protein
MGWRSDLLRPGRARAGALARIRAGIGRRGIVLLVLGALVVVAIAQADTRWFAPFTLSSSGQDAFSPQIAATPQGGSVAVWVRNGRIEAAVRAPGQSFGAAQVQFISDPNGASEPQVAVNPTNGDAYAVWTRSDGSKLRIQAAKHPSGGSWEATPQTISTAGQDAFGPQIAVDGSGNAFAVWARYDGTNNGNCCSRVEAAVRQSAQSTFGPPDVLSLEGQNGYEPQVTVDPNSNAVAIWTRFDGSNTRVQVSRRLDYNRYSFPIGASPMRLALVPAFVPCGSPGSSPTNGMHNAPLSGSSCNPPVPSSSVLAVGGKSLGFTRNVVLGVGQCTVFDSTKCYPDFTSVLNVTDVRSGSPTGPDFVGKIAARITVRITDLFSTDGPATVVDLPFYVPANCSATVDTTIGSTCSAQTSANGLLPGAARAGNRAVIEFGQVRVRDAGPNGSGYGTGCPPTCGDGDEQDFLRQGVFAP